jgi:hypothetical protein
VSGVEFDTDTGVGVGSKNRRASSPVPFSDDFTKFL